MTWLSFDRWQSLHSDIGFYTRIYFHGWLWTPFVRVWRWRGYRCGALRRQP